MLAASVQPRQSTQHTARQLKPTLNVLCLRRTRRMRCTNYAALMATAILVLISAHAKSALLSDNNSSSSSSSNNNNSNNNNNSSYNAAQIAITSTPIATPTAKAQPTIAAAGAAAAAAISTVKRFDDDDNDDDDVVAAFAEQSTQHYHTNNNKNNSYNFDSEENHNHKRQQQEDNHNRNHNHKHQHHHQHQQQHHSHHKHGSNGHHQRPDASTWPQRKQHAHHHRHNLLSVVAPSQDAYSVRPYRSKYTIEELQHLKIEHKIPADIDMDPCKASGFMGDIALPDINYGDDPIVAHTPIDSDWDSFSAGDADSWLPQGDDPAAIAPEKLLSGTKFNASFQQELEILKQEVYHEGLQVEEEGLTHIIRKKTKLPSSQAEFNSNERSRNDPVLSANEPIKPTSYTHNSDYLLKNLKNEVIGGSSGGPSESAHRRKLQTTYSTDGDYYVPKYSKPSHTSIDEAESPRRNGLLTRNGKATTFDANGKIESIALHRSDERFSSERYGTGSLETEKKYEQEKKLELEKLRKPIANLSNRNVDQRKIQSNTKDIEDDSGNNFVGERRVVILPTSLPTQRSTMPNVYSNAGGNGMPLDTMDVLSGEGTTMRRRHRRGRKNRRSSEERADYHARVQRLREELSGPVRTLRDYQTLQQQLQQQQQRLHWLSGKKQQNDDKQQHKMQQQKKAQFEEESEGGRQQQWPEEQLERQAGLAKNFNYSAEQSDEMEVLTKRKSTMDSNNSDSSTTFEMELQKAETIPHPRHHHHRMTRAVTAKKERIWDYGVIPYEIDGNFSGLHKALFKQAMRHWENSTCIKFVERDPEIHPNYIVFTVRSCGCCSFVGKRGNGPQAISIGRNCDKFGIVVHELGHVVGFWHEHTRPDREKHVVIEHNNIMKGQDYNFNKLTPDEVDSLGLPYDYDSIMHYARNTFSKGTYLDTILPIEVKGKKRPEIGQRLRLSAGDIAQANLLYKCPKCGRTFQENAGIFASPSYYTAGALSNETEHCEWRITATHGERVVLRLENMNIFKSNNCQTDYLEVRDGYYFKSPLIGRFCGKLNGEVLKTESSRMLLTYVNTHRAEGFRGFKAEFDVICGGELSIDDSEGRLESPNYPLEYLPNKECVWKISVPPGYQVAIKFQSFEVENHDSCVYDFVEVRDGPSQDSRLIGVFCGYKPPPNMKTTDNAMYVKFVSDTSVQKAGFSAIFMKEVDECTTQNHGCQHNCTNTLGGYECSCHIGYELHSDKKHCEDACGGVIEFPNGTITSPSFPDAYPVLKECIWEIIAPPKHKISLNFTHFDLEGNTQQQTDCGYDSVIIYSKLSEDRLKRIGTYCGSAIPPMATSEGNALRVEFRSDKTIQGTGFAASFSTDIDECSINNGGCQHECRNTIGSYMCFCHNGYSLHENGRDCKEGECKYEISASFGSIYSPNYPDLYPPNADCVWHFTTTPGHRIKLIFNEFNVESHQECAYDNVAVYDGESESSSLLGQFCGDKIPYPISSSTNQLYVVFKTDMNKQLTGFTAIHSTSCGGYLRATNHIQQFYSHSLFGNKDYNPNMDCEWTIQAPASSNVQLIFLTFDIEGGENCTYDYVQVYSGMEDTSGPMYGQYCGNTLPQDIISLTDSLLVRFKTDDTLSSKGFSASYVAVDPFDNSDEDLNSYSAERATPFPGSLKTIYEESEDYSDFSENHLNVRPRNRYHNGI